MEASLTALCSRAELPTSLVSQAAEFHRTLQAKQAGLGVSGTVQSVVCLHLAASQRGQPLDTKNMIRLAGAKSKPHYLGVLQNAEKILQLEQVWSFSTIKSQPNTCQVYDLYLYSNVSGSLHPGDLCPDVCVPGQ